jgi:hypothetical protein
VIETVRVHTVIEKDGEIRLSGLPFKRGQHVEMVVQSETSPQRTRAPLTARQLLSSGLIGLWKDRTDIDDSAVYARQLREQAQRRN